MPGGWALQAATDCPDPSKVDLTRGVLAMVGGHGIDIMDIDAKDGGRPEHLGPDVRTDYGCSRTPSGGWHYPTPSTGYGKVSPWASQGRPLGDYVGGTADGGGRMLAYLGGTRPKYPQGAYTVEVEWDLDRLLEDQPDDALVALLEQEGARNTGQAGARAATWREADEFLRGLADAPACPYGRTWLANVMDESRGAKAGDAVHGRHGWLMRVAPRFVELARYGCVAEADWLAIVQRMVEMKPKAEGECWELLAWALTNADGISQCSIHNPTDPMLGAKGTDPAPAIDQATGEVYTEMDLWAASDVLGDVYRAAVSRNRSPMAVLGAALALVSTAVGPRYVLPPTVGGKGSLNLAVILAGGTGSGKSTAWQIACEILPNAFAMMRHTGAGTGEGMLQTYLSDKIDPATGVLAMVNDRTFCYIDEYSQMKETAARAGNTYMSIMRSLISGSSVHTGNSSTDRRRSLIELTYRFGMVVGLQPKLSADMFSQDGVSGGTPQRFLWTSVKRPGRALADATEWPGLLGWLPKVEDDPDALNALSGIVPLEEIQFDYPESIKEHVRHMDDIADTLPDDQAHGTIMRLKVAAALAILHSRYGEFTMEDWRLAGIVMEHSQYTRDMCRRESSGQRTLAQRQAGKAEAIRAEARQEHLYDSAMAKARQKVLELLANNGGEPMRSSHMSARIPKSMRSAFTDALDSLVSDGMVVMEAPAADTGKRKPRYRLAGD
jgi:hypothetical protein